MDVYAIVSVKEKTPHLGKRVLAWDNDRKEWFPAALARGGAWMAVDRTVPAESNTVTHWIPMPPDPFGGRRHG